MIEMIYDEFGLYFAMGLFAIGLFRLFFQPTTGFLAPKKKINFGKKITFQSVVFLIFLFILLLPVNIGFVKNRKIVKEKNLPIQILFDVSLSMAGKDIKPSRFHATKKSLIFLLKELDGYNISLIAFSGKPFVFMPFSTNTKALQNKFKNTVLADFNPTKDFVGTAIGNVLLLGVRNIQTLYETNLSEKKLTKFSPGVVILITDGDSNVGVDPINVIKTYKEMGIPIFTLGIGDKDFKVGKDKYGNDVVGYTNIDLLKKISQETNGNFYKVKNITDFFNIFDEISSIVKQQETKKIKYEYFYINQVLLFVITVFGIVLFFFKIKK